VVNAPPDGHTLLMVPPAVAANPTLYEHLSFNFLRDTTRWPAWCACPTSPR
jgi:hypothetical protein